MSEQVSKSLLELMKDQGEDINYYLDGYKLFYRGLSILFEKNPQISIYGAEQTFRQEHWFLRGLLETKEQRKQFIHLYEFFRAAQQKDK